MTSPAAVWSTVQALLDSQEDENCEFKEAKNDYDFEKLVKYCCALANEGGGRIVLGVSDRRPRPVVGTAAYPQIEQVRSRLVQKLPLLIRVHEHHHPDGRVLVFEIPARPIGVPVQCDGRYWSRHGESLVAMPEERLREVFSESGRDCSAECCSSASLSD